MLAFRWPYLEVSRPIDASPEAVWEAITDTSQWPLWGPSVVAVECDTRIIRQESEGRVRTALGFWAPFCVDRYVDGVFWSWRVFGIPATGHRIEETTGSNGTCRLIFQVPFIAAPYALVCSVAIGRIARLVEGRDR